MNAFLHQFHPMPRQIPQLADLNRRHEAGTNQPMRQQIRDPFSVARIGLLVGNALDLIRIGQNQRKVFLQCIPYRLPVNPGRFNMQDTARTLPVGFGEAVARVSHSERSV